MIIYLSRHPQTIWNLEKILQWHLDSKLSDLWIKTAYRLSDLLKDRGIEKIYSSDLWRCRETSEIINQKLNVDILFSLKLRERDFWDYNWKTKELVKTKFDLNDFELIAPNWESNMQLKDRINDYFLSIIKDWKEKNILIITHDWWVRSILSEALNLDFNDANSGIKQWSIVKLISENDNIILDEIIF